MKEPDIKPTVKLIDTNGNAFAIIGRVKDALLKAGADNEYVDKYQDEVLIIDIKLAFALPILLFFVLLVHFNIPIFISV